MNVLINLIRTSLLIVFCVISVKTGRCNDVYDVLAHVFKRNNKTWVLNPKVIPIKKSLIYHFGHDQNYEYYNYLDSIERRAFLSIDAIKRISEDEAEYSDFKNVDFEYLYQISDSVDCNSLWDEAILNKYSIPMADEMDECRLAVSCPLFSYDGRFAVVFTDHLCIYVPDDDRNKNLSEVIEDGEGWMYILEKSNDGSWGTIGCFLIYEHTT